MRAQEPPKRYSLPPPPPWPPARSEYPPGKDFKVLFDPFTDKDRDGRFAALIEKVREAGIDDGEDARIKGRGKGKETLTRYQGKVVGGEPEPVIRDPRKVEDFRKPMVARPLRTELYEIKYEYDSNSTGPPPPTAILVTNVSPLMPNQEIRRHFSKYGPILTFDPQIDKTTGGALGIVFIKFSTHDEARRCVDRENGKQLGTGTVLSLNGGSGQEMKVMLDGEGKKLKAILRELDDRRRRERDAKRRKEQEEKDREVAARATPKVLPGHVPSLPTNPWRVPHPYISHPPHLSHPTPRNPITVVHTSTLPAPSPSLPPKPATPSQISRFPGAGPLQPMAPRVRRPPASLVRARIITNSKFSVTPHAAGPSDSTPHSSTSTPLPSRPRARALERNDHWSPMRTTSRSPSPVSRKPGQSSRSAQQKQREIVVDELARNGFDHVRVDGHGGQLGGAIREDDVKQFFEGFKVDKILQDHMGWYVSFQTSDSARRAAMVLNSGARTLAHRSVTVTVYPAPTSSAATMAKTTWKDDELVEQASQMISKELRQTLERDIVDRLVGVRYRRLVSEYKTTRPSKSKAADGREGVEEERVALFAINSLKGLSFKKQNKRVREEFKVPLAKAEATPEPEKTIDAAEVVERPKKKRKKEVVKVVEDIESEDEEAVVPIEEDRKRAVSEERDDEEPAKKRAKMDITAADVLEVHLKKDKKTKKGARKVKSVVVEEHIDEVVYPEDLDYAVPTVTHLRVTPPLPPSLVPAPHRPPKVATPADPFERGLCADDEDVYFARLALAERLRHEPQVSKLRPVPEDEHEQDVLPPFRVHVTGSARTEGYYKISHAEKSAYVAQYASRSAAADSVEELPAQQPKPTMTSSRSNRANARRQAQGLEEINQVQRAMALSKGETAAAELSIKFNQLQTRKKHLRFARSPIHDWGLYAMERIARGEMVIEYVGEVIRAQVADKREKAYERQGIGSSYLFRIDEDLVVDATKKGNLGRLINHSCDPNCTAKIITINSEKKIVIYAKQDIELGDEITYDYHFPIEQDKIPCLCGSAKCRGYLN
ncbi:hypothetical protein EW146_g5561 [Bondarzewia mesenterica]|uniref:Histone-lysine N-methyltransferase, H3 lysine-4 specific n=1 Tax=Bondarzewia mesenterica TaxID=1095465 RepID=A0A4S4LS65_9AGAM|nr:hypothetical protein EW146_g5561 [Bondarzewia mesenterica]